MSFALKKLKHTFVIRRWTATHALHARNDDTSFRHHEMATPNFRHHEGAVATVVIQESGKSY